MSYNSKEEFLERRWYNTEGAHTRHETRNSENVSKPTALPAQALPKKQQKSLLVKMVTWLKHLFENRK
jgi:hypothetical protein